MRNNPRVGSHQLPEQEARDSTQTNHDAYGAEGSYPTHNPASRSADLNWNGPKVMRESAQSYNQATRPSRGQTAWENSPSDFSHAGKGPKGYRRSDERIKEEISDIFMKHPQIDASEIEVEVKDGEATLTGTVPSRRMKRLLEDSLDAVLGLHDISNQTRVLIRTAGETNEKGIVPGIDPEDRGLTRLRGPTVRRTIPSGEA